MNYERTNQLHTAKTLEIFALAIKAIEAAYIYTDEIMLVVGSDTGENELEQSILERLNKNST